MADITIDTTVTRARLIRNSAPEGYSTDNFVTMGPSTTIDFYSYFGGPSGLTSTHLYIVEMDGYSFPSEDYFPAVPSGYTLTDVRPWVSAYLVGGPQDPYDGSGDGVSPPPTQYPYLFMNSTDALGFDTFVAYPGALEVCGAPDDLSLAMPGGGGALADDLQESGVASTMHIVVTAFGYRFTYSSAGPTIQPPLRQYPRTDGLGASGVRRVYPAPRSQQNSNRRAGGYL